MSPILLLANENSPTNPPFGSDVRHSLDLMRAISIGPQTHLHTLRLRPCSCGGSTGQCPLRRSSNRLDPCLPQLSILSVLWMFTNAGMISSVLHSSTIDPRVVALWWTMPSQLDQVCSARLSTISSSISDPTACVSLFRYLGWNSVYFFFFFDRSSSFRASSDSGRSAAQSYNAILIVLVLAPDSPALSGTHSSCSNIDQIINALLCMHA